MGLDLDNACKLFKQTNGVRFITPVYGVCYTFNFGPYLSLLGKKLEMIAANIFFGLILEIDIECKRTQIFVFVLSPCERREWGIY